VGDRKAKDQTAFIVCAQPESRYAAQELRARGWAVLTGRRVSSRAHKVLGAGSRRIVLGHGSDEELWLACGSHASSIRWLWVGMKAPPHRVRLYLYSCHCGRRLAPWLRNCFVFGHYRPVPIPSRETHTVVLPFLEKVFVLIDSGSHASPAAIRRVLKRLAAELLRVHFLSGGLPLMAALVLSESLYR
jgi:hypothetical protein